MHIPLAESQLIIAPCCLLPCTSSPSITESLVQVQTSLGDLFSLSEPLVPSKFQGFHSELYQALDLFLLRVPPSHRKQKKVSIPGTESLASLCHEHVRGLHLNLLREESCLVLGILVCLCFLWFS